MTTCDRTIQHLLDAARIAKSINDHARVKAFLDEVERRLDTKPKTLASVQHVLRVDQGCGFSVHEALVHLGHVRDYAMATGQSDVRTKVDAVIADIQTGNLRAAQRKTEEAMAKLGTSA